MKAKTPTKCAYKDQGASKGTKILYDAGAVTLVSQGSKLLPSPEDDRYMAWAIFTQRSTGKKFFFATAHLEPDKDWNLHVQRGHDPGQGGREAQPQASCRPSSPAT